MPAFGRMLVRSLPISACLDRLLLVMVTMVRLLRANPSHRQLVAVGSITIAI